MKYLTFTEAAAFTGLSFKTIHKHVKQGKLCCIETPLGKRIAEEALLPYLELKGIDGNDREQIGHPEPEQSALNEPVEISLNGNKVEQTAHPNTPDRNEVEQSAPAGKSGADQGGSFPSVPLEAHLASMELAREQLERAQRLLEAERKRSDESERLALQAERGRMALEFQLGQYQRALGEQADSLIEERAARLQAQALADSRESDEVRTLAEENARQLQEFEQEKAALTERLKMSENRVDWLEKRVPRWVRSLFRAG